MNERKPMLSLIAAMARNRVIGKDNAMPWHLPADLKRFKTLTMGKPMIMGRKTWESLPGLLPGRPHIVVTRNPEYQTVGAQTASSLQQAIDLAGAAEEIMIIGGGALYAQALPLAQRMYLSIIQADVEGDTWFPDYAENDWQVIETTQVTSDEFNPFDCEFVTLQRKTCCSPTIRHLERD